MASVCEHCKNNAYDTEEQVCKACGIVTEEIKFGTMDFHGFSSHVSYKSSLCGKKQLPSGLIYGMDILNFLSEAYNISSDVKAEILELLKKVHSKRSFRCKEDIGVMAGCCLIYVQKKYEQYVPLTDLCAKLHCTKKKVFQYSKALKLNYNESNQNDFVGSDLTDDLKEIPSGSDLDLLSQLESLVRIKLSSVPEDSKTSLIKKTTSLMKLAYSCWIVSGRSIEAIISAAAFLCWKSMHPSRRVLTFRKFCLDFSLPYNKAKSRVTELKAMLVKLGKEIPSITQNCVTRSNVLFHLDYILENSETLRNDLLSEEFTLDEINRKEYSIFRKSSCNHKRNSTNIEITKYDTDMNASDIEISDTEIDSYIRTEEQIAVVKSLREKKC